MSKGSNKILLVFLVVVSVACLLFMTASVTRTVLSFFAPETAIEASLRNNVDFQVVYLDNDVFGSGPAPKDLYYLMSFTDYIEIENTLAAEFSQQAEVDYTYTATERLLIRHQRGGDRNANPIVYEEKITLAEDAGSLRARALSLPRHEDKPDGFAYVVYPKDFIDVYREFVAAQLEQMQREDVRTERAVTFAAELVLDFTYTIRSDKDGLNETIRRGLVIPLTDEVFSPEDTGTPVQETAIPKAGFEMPPWHIIAIQLFLWLVAPIAGLCYGLRRLSASVDPRRAELERILRKYADEITVSTEPMDLSGHKIAEVTEFRELLKLAINLNKHILCFYNDDLAEFCALADGYAHCYTIYFETDGDEATV